MNYCAAKKVLRLVVGYATNRCVAWHNSSWTITCRTESQFGDVGVKARTASFSASFLWSGWIDTILIAWARSVCPLQRSGDERVMGLFFFRFVVASACRVIFEPPLVDPLSFPNPQRLPYSNSFISSHCTPTTNYKPEPRNITNTPHTSPPFQAALLPLLPPLSPLWRLASPCPSATGRGAMASLSARQRARSSCCYGGEEKIIGLGFRE